MADRGSHTTARSARIARDLAAIGPWAPVRAAYELSRRTGVHAALFGSLARRTHERATPSSRALVERSAGFVDPAPAVDAVLADARDIVAGRVRLFSREVEVGTEPDWHAVLHRAGTWPARSWWTIELRADDRPGDVKWAWELGRHRHLVVLARAAALEPSNDVWISTLARQLGTFLEQNPPEVGVHWCSSLELALRAFAWLEIVGTIGDRLDARLLTDLEESLWHAGLHILAELPYSLSSMQNNHLLGEAAGLVALGRALDLHRWHRVGRSLYDAQLARELNPDGSTVEESLSYQRFVMDIVIRRIQAGGQEDELHPSRLALRRGAGFLQRLGVLDGAVPQFGDWDEGRAVVTSDDPTDLAGTVALSESIAGPASSPRGASHDHRSAAVGGSMATASAGGMRVWLRAGPTRWHAHADLCSIAIRCDGEWLAGDPGTGSYNGDDEERAWFRSSASHAVLELGGAPLVEPHRTFRWQAAPWAAVGAPLQLGATSIVWAAHAAYDRAVCRVVLLEDEEITVLDAIEPLDGSPALPYLLRLPLGPGTGCRDDSELRLPTGRVLHLTPPLGATVDEVPARWSPTYGTVVPSRQVVARGIVRDALVTSLTASGAPRWTPDGAGVRCGASRVAVGWRGTVISIHALSPGVSHVRTVERPA